MSCFKYLRMTDEREEPAFHSMFHALSNAVCLYNAFFAIDFCKCFLFSCFVLDY